MDNPKTAAAANCPAGVPVAHAPALKHASRAPSTFPRLTWRETVSRMRADRDRLAAVLTYLENSPARLVWLHPSFLAAFFYRIASYLYRGGYTLPARLVWQFNMIVTGADINAAAEIGEGLVVMHPAGTAIMGKIGRNFTLMPCGGVGGETGRREDIGAGPGLAVVGDDVIVEPHGGILGPIRIGDRARIGAGIAVTKDVPADIYVEWPKPRFLRRCDLP